MKEADVNDLELGNLMFGHSRGKYKIEPRQDYQYPFAAFLDRIGFDHYGYSGNGTLCFENDTFIIRPYYWGENEEIQKLPNFVYKPTDLQIKWYKYPMRDAYSNQDISPEMFKQIVLDCEMSMEDDG